MNRKDAAELEDERFAGDIANWLDEERKKGALGSIDIISGPGFLGKLRNGMTSECADVVDKEVTKTSSVPMKRPCCITLSRSLVLYAIQVIDGGTCFFWCRQFFLAHL